MTEVDKFGDQTAKIFKTIISKFIIIIDSRYLLGELLEYLKINNGFVPTLLIVSVFNTLVNDINSIYWDRDNKDPYKDDATFHKFFYELDKIDQKINPTVVERLREVRIKIKEIIDSREFKSIKTIRTKISAHSTQGRTIFDPKNDVQFLDLYSLVDKTCTILNSISIILEQPKSYLENEERKPIILESFSQVFKHEENV